MTQRYGTGREEGGGFRMGNTCRPVADHVDIWQNQYNTVKLKNKIKKTPPPLIEPCLEARLYAT